MRRSVEKGNALQQSKQCGEVSEWSKEHAWKVCKSKGFEGSNPSLSATNIEGESTYYVGSPSSFLGLGTDLGTTLGAIKR